MLFAVCWMLYVVCCICMLHVACCMLHAVCCMLYVMWCMLHVACCMLHAACCMLHVHVPVPVHVRMHAPTTCRADLGSGHRGCDYRAHGTHLLLGHGLEVSVGELQRASLREQCRVCLQRLTAAATAAAAAGSGAWQVQ